MEAMKNMKDNEYDLAIYDPPYGINKSGQKEQKKFKKSDRKYFEDKQWDVAIPKKEYFTELFRVSQHQIIWGANYFVEHLVEGHKGWIVWDKGQYDLTMSDCELAYSSFDCKTRFKKINRVELLKQRTIHPTEKPTRLYKWLLQNYAKEGNKILDTHLGSGSIALACWDLGFSLTGFEIDIDYYNSAVTRLDRHKSQGQLF